jgi:small membrane protein
VTQTQVVGMTLFQILGVGLTGGFALLSCIGAWRRQVGRVSGAFWTLVWTAAALSIALPETTVTVARALGIARGADLVFYCAILAMMVGFFLIYVRLRRIDRAITVLVQRIALDEAPPSPDAGTAGPRRDAE